MTGHFLACIASRPRTGLYLISLLLFFLAACTPVASEYRSSAATLTPTPTVDRLAAPVLPKQPNQADLGAQIYYQVCMACHGDRGQGLTDEWREIWEEDSNCWTSKCHGPNHPPHGFQFPKITSPVVGEGTLSSFENAQELNTYLVDTMPWWNPGYLKEEEYWQVTSFLMRAHDALPDKVTISPGNASIFPLHLASPLPGDERPEVFFIAGILVIIAVLVAFQGKFRD